MSFLKSIEHFIESDAQLAKLFENVREYAELYLIAKQRQKGCDGMGEVATLKDEFIYSLQKMLGYCKSKNYIKEDVVYSIDSIIMDISTLKLLTRNGSSNS